MDKQHHVYSSQATCFRGKGSNQHTMTHKELTDSGKTKHQENVKVLYEKNITMMRQIKDVCWLHAVSDAAEDNIVLP